MRIGVPKEIKIHEYRVGLTPAGVRELTHQGHEVTIESGAGASIGLGNEQYTQAGARIANSAEDVFDWAELIVKVKEPQPEECRRLRQGQTLFTYLHLAPDPQQADLLLQSKCTAIAYETVTDQRGQLPLLAPMSEVAGRMAIQAGAHCLEMAQGGNGTLLAGVPGVLPGMVVILGGGVVGTNAARMALGLGARVMILDKSIPRLQQLDERFGPQLLTCYSQKSSIESAVASADLVIGAVLLPGAAAPKLIDRAMLATMKRGAVIVDVAIDQGGCVETSRPTTHQSPTFIVDEVVHYCVANMPGAVARTSTFALTNATLPFVLELAAKGSEKALLENPGLRAGLNVYNGELTHAQVAEALGKPLRSAVEALESKL